MKNFEEQFPSLKDFDVNCKDLVHNMKDHFLLKNVINRINTEVEVQLEECCLDKQRVKQVISKNISFCNNWLRTAQPSRSGRVAYAATENFIDLKKIEEEQFRYKKSEVLGILNFCERLLKELGLNENE